MPSGNRRHTALLLLTLGWLVAPFAGCGTPASSGRELLKAKAKKLSPDMTIAEVNAVMRGHPSEVTQSEYPAGMLSGFGKEARTTRAAVLVIKYDDKRGADEGDYFLHARFDEDGKLVAVGIGEYWN